MTALDGVLAMQRVLMPHRDALMVDERSLDDDLRASSRANEVASDFVGRAGL
jgi:hypothetical protein